MVRATSTRTNTKVYIDESEEMCFEIIEESIPSFTQDALNVSFSFGPNLQIPLFLLILSYLVDIH